MSDKFNIYDLLGTVVPGTLIVCLLPVALPELAASTKNLKLPDSFEVLGLIALALFAGSVVQAVSSLVDPLLYWAWGGRPSERGLESGLGERYLPEDAARRIRAKLEKVVGAGATLRSLFLFAMQRAESASPQRVTTFNALFAYHRALLILTAVGVGVAVAIVSGQGPPTWTPGLRWRLLAGSVLLLALFWHRTKQRAFYYVREVLHTAERVLDQKPVDQPPAQPAPAGGAPAGQAAPVS